MTSIGYAVAMRYLSPFVDLSKIVNITYSRSTQSNCYFFA